MVMVMLMVSVIGVVVGHSIAEWICKLVRLIKTEKKPTDYVFPFLLGGETGLQLRDRTRNSLKKVNKHIKIIAQKLNLGIDSIGTYHSRHSFASISKNAGISIQNISESLGHSSLAVTKSYLSSLEDEQIFEHAKILL